MFFGVAWLGPGLGSGCAEVPVVGMGRVREPRLVPWTRYGVAAAAEAIFGLGVVRGF